jgi:hypothetical protein
MALFLAWEVAPTEEKSDRDAQGYLSDLIADRDFGNAQAPHGSTAEPPMALSAILWM